MRPIPKLLERLNPHELRHILPSGKGSERAR
jgi:hypothetical protein